MRYLSFGLDNRALSESDNGHSRYWHEQLGRHTDQVDVLVECRGKKDLKIRHLAKNVRIIPVCNPFAHLYHIYAVRCALKEHSRKPYDIVISEDPFRTGLAATMFCKKTGVAYSCEYHTECFSNRDWISTRPITHRIYQIIGRQSIRCATSVRCVNKQNVEQLRKLCADQPDKIFEAIPTPVRLWDTDSKDASYEIRTKCCNKNTDILLLHLGRLEPVKRVDLLLRTFSRLKRRFPDISLLIVGDGSQREYLERLASTLQLTDCKFEGYVREDLVFGYYRAANIFVNPSMTESYGRVFLEAMSTKLPVISTLDAGAVADGLIANGETGLIFDPMNDDTFEDAISLFIENKQLRKNCGEGGYARVRSRFSYESTIRRCIELWERTINLNCK